MNDPFEIQKKVEKYNYQMMEYFIEIVKIIVSGKASDKSKMEILKDLFNYGHGVREEDSLI